MPLEGSRASAPLWPNDDPAGHAFWPRFGFAALIQRNKGHAIPNNMLLITPLAVSITNENAISVQLENDYLFKIFP